MIPLLTVQAVREAERAYEAGGGDLAQLMDHAGKAVADRVEPGRRVLVLAGPGNNGGDALIAAGELRRRGHEVRSYTFKRPDAGESVSRHEEDSHLSSLQDDLKWADTVVDGLLGIGANRPLQGDLAAIVEAVNGSSVPERFAIDVPTGVDADSGEVQTTAVRATRTITLGHAKRGLWSFPGAAYAGRIEIADIGLGLPPGRESDCHLVEPDDVASLLPTRERDWNKGKSGTVLVVSGSADYRGAPALCAMAAYRAGAGLVSVATPSVARNSTAVRCPEAIFPPVSGEHGYLTPDDIGVLTAAMDKADAFAIGPGLGIHPETVSFCRMFLQEMKQRSKPGVLDADGLNAVAQIDNWWECVPPCLVVTPHPGEMARLRHTSVSQVQRDRFETARNGAKEWRVTVLLKGAYTIVAQPDGVLMVNPVSSPNLATAGTGDVLTGMVASLLAQGMAAPDAAITAAFIHGTAGVKLTGRHGDAGTVASDLWAEIPSVRRDLTSIVK